VPKIQFIPCSRDLFLVFWISDFRFFARQGTYGWKHGLIVKSAPIGNNKTELKGQMDNAVKAENETETRIYDLAEVKIDYRAVKEIYATSKQTSAAHIHEGKTVFRQTGIKSSSKKKFEL
jgi:hypothetical protein